MPHDPTHSAHARFHAHWLGLVQPSEGLVFSIPVLADAQILERQPRDTRDRAREHAPETRPGGPRRIRDLGAFLEDILELAPPDLDPDPPAELALYVAEGRQTLRPTHALRALEPRDIPPDASPAVTAGARYAALIYDLDPAVHATAAGDPLPLDRPEDTTGPWRAAPAVKFDRLLRACGVPVGLLTHRETIRLVYAPVGQTTGWIDFRLADMLTPGGEPVLDAFVALLRAERWFAVTDDQTLPALLARSRARQADVTDALAEQVHAALEALLDGFARADARDPQTRFTKALAARDADDDPVYAGLLTVLLRLVVLLYAEAHDLMPVEHPLYAASLGVIDLYDRLLEDAGAHPDEMDRRYGAWPRLLATFRAVYFGVEWQPDDPAEPAMRMPPRRGDLFDPTRYPWLEGRDDGRATPDPVADADVRTPAIDDATVHAVLGRLIVLDGQRLSYKALDVEQIGSVYERLMGYRIQQLDGPAVCVRPTGVWLTADAVLARRANRRERWLQDEAGLPRAAAKRLAAAIAAAAPEGPPAVLDAIAAEAGYRDRRRPRGALVLQPGSERRRTSSHYTPRTLSAPIVARTIDPLLATLAATHGAEPTAEQILSLTLCDPAMGSGAFLVESCRYLADRLVAAWTRDGTADRLAATEPDLHLRARRLVAQRCLYGVDKNPFAVALARISLWLVTMARDEPFTFVDHALRHGDSLVGLDLDQIIGFDWRPTKQLTLVSEVIRQTLEESVEIRLRIRALADSPDTREKERLLDQAEYFTERARLIADVCVGAFFAADKKAARERERTRRLALLESWLRDDDDAPEAGETLRAMQDALRAQVPAFHWMLEFPEVFWAERPDPLGGGAPGVAWVDGFVGNPPFAGKNAISAANADGYLDWFYESLPEVKGRPNTDLCAYFFRRAATLLGPHGTVGFIATNTIAQGDSRMVGLKPLIMAGGVIYDARVDFPWPGGAAVTASSLSIAFGAPRSQLGSPRIDGSPVPAINSRLRPMEERDEPKPLVANADRAFMGGKLVGVGLAVDLDEHADLIARDSQNAAVLRPYLGGQEVNNDPACSFNRYVIDFTDMTLDEARAWPSLMEIVETRVKPARMSDKRGTYRTYWWRPGESAGALYKALSGLSRCLVACCVSKHLSFSFQPTTIFFSQTVYVFAFDTWAHFAVLQSRAHEPWARLLSSSMKTDLRYSGANCFETFPFPPDLNDPALEAAGEALYTARADYMLRHQQGLTATYNQLKDPDCTDDEIEHLRRLHEAMDRAVLDAYGWRIPVPPYGTADPTEQQTFEDEIIDRLFVLNAERAAAEAGGAATAKRGGGGGRKSGDDATLSLGFD